MDRLVCGDVGFGKTEVAIRAAFKAVQAGRQVAVLVPTTILAQQHYGVLERFARLSGAGRDAVAVPLGGRAPEPSACLSRRLGRRGRRDLPVAPKRRAVPQNLGLIVVDEEQRFGVNAEGGESRSCAASVDVLTLRPTRSRARWRWPTGLRDLSLIDTPPAERQPRGDAARPGAGGRCRGDVRLTRKLQENSCRK